MQPKDLLFSQCSQFYADLKSKFQEFCSVCTSSMNENQYFPEVTVRLSESGDYIELRALGKSLIIEVDIIDENCNLGLLKASLQTRDDKQLLHFVYFDRLGNVKSQPDASAEFYSVNEKLFIQAFTNDIARKLIDHNKAALTNQSSQPI